MKDINEEISQLNINSVLLLLGFCNKKMSISFGNYLGIIILRQGIKY